MIRHVSQYGLSLAKRKAEARVAKLRVEGRLRVQKGDTLNPWTYLEQIHLTYQGCVAELAVAMVLESTQAWLQAGPGDRFDIPGRQIEVKSTHYPRGGLILPSYQSVCESATYVLAIVSVDARNVPTGRVRLPGGVSGRQVADRPLTTEYGGRPKIYVPQSELTPFTELGL